MAVKTPQQYRARFPKFSNASDAVISAALAEAALLVSEEAFLTRYDYAIEIKAGVILESMKYGQIGPPPKKGETQEFASLWDELCATSPIRGMVL